MGKEILKILRLKKKKKKKKKKKSVVRLFKILFIRLFKRYTY